MKEEPAEWNDDIRKIRDPLQRTLAQGHFDRAKDARGPERRKERIDQLAEAGLIILKEQHRELHPSMRDRIIFAPLL